MTFERWGYKFDGPFSSPDSLQPIEEVYVILCYREEEARKEASRCLRCDLRFRLSPVILPPEKWLEFSPEVVSQVPDSEGAFQLLDEEKSIIYIAGTPNLKQTLQEQLSSNQKARFLIYEEYPM